MLDPLFEHQEKALKKLSNGKILWGGVGSGKTRVAVEYYKLREAPRDVYVITTAKKRDDFDWQNEFYKHGIGPVSGPTPIPGNRGKASVRGNRSGNGKATSGSSSRGLDPNADVVPGFIHGQSGTLSAGGRSGETSAGLLGTSAEPTADAGRDRAAAGQGSNHGVSVLGAAGPPRQETDHVGSVWESTASHRLPSDARFDGGAERASYRISDEADEYGSSLLLGEAGVGGDGHQNPVWEAGAYPYVLTVDSWNNIGKYADVSGAFFIFDEQRLVGSGDWVRKFLRIAKRNRWILLTATPGDTWMDYAPVFIANDFYKNRTAFKREHVVYNTFTKFPKVDRYINVGRLMRQRAQLLVEMPYVRHTRRRHVEVPLPYDKEALDMVLKKRWHVYEERPLRDIAEMCSVSRKVVNSDPSRLEMVAELWKNHPKLIVFYNFNYELESLRLLSEYSGISTREIGTRTNTAGAGSGVTTPTPNSTDGLSATRETSGLVIPTGSAKISRDHQPRSLTTRGRMDSGGRTESSVGTNEWNGWTDRCTDESIGATGTKTGFLSSTKLTGVPARTPLLSSIPMTLSLGRSSESSTSAPKTWSGSSSVDPTNSQASVTSQAIAEWNGHKHQPIPSTDRWLYLVQYTAGAEGWNCIETDAMIMYSRNYSWKVTEQAYGRIDRLNSPFTYLWYYGFTSDSWIDRAIGRSLRAKETFNEAKYAGLFKA